MPENPTEKEDHWQWDPTFLHSRREAIFILIIWALCLLWTVPFCYLTGYMDLESGRLPWLAQVRVLGMPGWMFWGVAFPWLVAGVVTVWFCYRFLQLDDLGQAPEEQEAEAASPSGNEPNRPT